MDVRAGGGSEFCGGGIKKDTQPKGWMSYGASDEARTRYLHLGKVALYQMSYTRNSELYYSTNLACVKGFFKKISKSANCDLCV